MDIQQNPEMWANARRQSRENSIAAAHVALKHGHLTKGGLRAHTFMEKMLGSKLGADTVENMSSETFRIEAEVLRQEYTKTQAKGFPLQWGAPRRPSLVTYSPTLAFTMR